MGHLVIYLCEKCQYLFDLENRQGDSQDGRAAAGTVRAAVGQRRIASRNTQVFASYSIFRRVFLSTLIRFTCFIVLSKKSTSYTAVTDF